MKARKRKVRILPYRRGSVSARALSRATGILRTTGRGPWHPKDYDIIINWGRHACQPQEGLYGPFWSGRVRYYNYPHNVALAWDKRKTLELLAHNEVPTVPWTQDVQIATQWYMDGHIVVQRNTATGQGGAGIVVCDPTLTVNATAPNHDGVLWTKYFKRKQEFRVHVWGNDILDIQEKKRRKGSNADSKVRSYGNGWVFCREGVACPQAVSNAAVAAVSALGLDFGAVDIGWNQLKELPAVFEVNTAPGVEGTTLARYAEKIKQAVGER